MNKKEQVKKTGKVTPRHLEHIVQPVWSFLWSSFDEIAYGNDTWRVRVYKTKTIEKACQKMNAFLGNRPYDPILDYEAYAKHEGKNIDLYSFDNPLRANWL